MSNNTKLWLLAFAITLLITLVWLMTFPADAQSGTGQSSVEDWQSIMADRGLEVSTVQYYPQGRVWQQPYRYAWPPQGGYRFYDKPLERPQDILPPRWSDQRAQWPRDYRYRRECWFRAEC
jgi:hypothetical protein